MKIYSSKAILVMALFLSLNSFAQTSGLGTWNVLSAKVTFDQKWSVLGEAQVRSQQVVNDFNYYEYKAGIGYNFPKTVSVLFAMGHYGTMQPTGNFKKPYVNDEFRIWQQLVLTNNIGRIKLEHRYRIEQRFTSYAGYRNRFRYRINAIVPINNAEIKPRTWYTSVFNELFVTNETPYYEQNRIFIGAGYQFNKNFTLLCGWINRFDQSNLNIPSWKNYFQTNLIFSFDEFKSGRERHPSALD
ncbi:MAG: DUF2490 domain-containing protein [Bacteroidota bacterium]|nr:DUF2490 domain-containing protein [Bacteroidota bacterium]